MSIFSFSLFGDSRLSLRNPLLSTASHISLGFPSHLGSSLVVPLMDELGIIQNLLFCSQPFIPISSSSISLNDCHETCLQYGSIIISVVSQDRDEIMLEAGVFGFDSSEHKCLSVTDGFDLSQELSISQLESSSTLLVLGVVVKISKRRGRKHLSCKVKKKIEAGIQSTLLDSFSPIIQIRSAS